jgi:hypothetical protein
LSTERTDIVGERAIQIMTLEYFKARNRDDVPDDVIDRMREWICLARGWEIER